MCSCVAPMRDPFIAESGANACGDHRLQVSVAELKVDPMQQLAAVADLLDRRQIAVLVMHARQSIANELLGHVCRAVPAPLLLFLCRELGTLAGLVEHAERVVGHASIQVSVGVAVECPARRIGRIASNSGELECLAVVEGGVSATMLNATG